MTYAPGITLRPWTVGGTTTTESGEALFTRAKVTASRSLMLWGATGWRYESSPKTITSTEGAQVSGELPVCDQSGWRTRRARGTPRGHRPRGVPRSPLPRHAAQRAASTRSSSSTRVYSCVVKID